MSREPKYFVKVENGKVVARGYAVFTEIPKDCIEVDRETWELAPRFVKVTDDGKVVRLSDKEIEEIRKAEEAKARERAIKAALARRYKEHLPDIIDALLRNDLNAVYNLREKIRKEVEELAGPGDFSLPGGRGEEARGPTGS